MTHHTGPLARGLAAASAILLIVASGGFGCYFAWTQGQHHGPLLGVLAVAMALGLELGKPLAVSGVFTSLREWRLGQALALVVLAVVAISYSLTAELSLMATTRGDLVAKRSAQSDAGAKAQARYRRAEGALAALEPSRPAAALRAEIEAIDRLPGIMIDGVPCGGTLNGKITKEWCPKRADLQVELARAEERQRLEAELREAEADQAKAGAVTAPDPAASALSHYLTIFGFAVAAELISEWFVLVGVIALEAGSALAVLLMRAVSVPDLPRVQGEARLTLARTTNLLRTWTLSLRPWTAASPTAPDVSKAAPPKRPRGQRLGQLGSVTKASAEVRIVDTLKERGGRLERASVRGIAALIGGRKSTVHSALAGLVAAGVVARMGSEIVLSAGA